MLIFISWLALALGIGAIARARNRSFWGFAVLSLVLSPIIGLIVVLVGKNGGKKCPACAEMIKAEAVKCRHCGHILSVKQIEEEALAKVSGLDGV